MLIFKLLFLKYILILEIPFFHVFQKFNIILQNSFLDIYFCPFLKNENTFKNKKTWKNSKNVRP